MPFGFRLSRAQACRRPRERARDRTWKGLVASRGSLAFRRASSKLWWKGPLGSQVIRLTSVESVTVSRRGTRGISSCLVVMRVCPLWWITPTGLRWQRAISRVSVTNSLRRWLAMEGRAGTNCRRGPTCWLSPRRLGLGLAPKNYQLKLSPLHKTSTDKQVKLRGDRASASPRICSGAVTGRRSEGWLARITRAETANASGSCIVRARPSAVWPW